MGWHAVRHDLGAVIGDRRVAVIGGGVIGASWAALFLAKGLRVVANAISPKREARPQMENIPNY